MDLVINYISHLLSGIVVSPSDGASSDSCLKSSSNPNPALSTAVGDLSSLLASNNGPEALAPAGTPLALSSNLLLQNQGSMLAASFQEGRRASDTSLTQGEFHKNEKSTLKHVPGL